MARRWIKKNKRGQTCHHDNEASTSRGQGRLSIEKREAQAAKECFWVDCEME
jgi:hypothetical protein